MCGEHQRRTRAWKYVMGSSPHVRGARLDGPVEPPVPGIIPACAGSTPQPWWEALRLAGSSPHVRGAPRSRRTSCTPSWDHPRMCGEHIKPLTFVLFSPGSSPHVRGALYYPYAELPAVGIIPACAGSTHQWDESPALTGDHPRMCGEHWQGLRHALHEQGIIPACAGSTPGRRPHAALHGDHPRMCGEHRCGKSRRA